MRLKYALFRELLDILEDSGFSVTDADMNEYDGAMEVSGSDGIEKVTFRVKIEPCGGNQDAK